MGKRLLIQVIIGLLQKRLFQICELFVHLAVVKQFNVLRHCCHDRPVEILKHALSALVDLNAVDVLSKDIPRLLVQEGEINSAEAIFFALEQLFKFLN